MPFNRDIRTKTRPGDVFGMLTVVRRAPNRDGQLYYLMKCECGTAKEVAYRNLTAKKGATVTCGCKNK